MSEIILTGRKIQIRKKDQPGHPPSLIRGFVVRISGSQGPNASSCRQWRLIRLGRWPGWSETLQGEHAVFTLSCFGSNKLWNMAYLYLGKDMFTAKAEISLLIYAVWSVFAVPMISLWPMESLTNTSQMRRLAQVKSSLGSHVIFALPQILQYQIWD